MKYPASNIRRAFSLIEVLLAVFILAIGLIMVASIFPVGADWTRQSTEASVGQNIALDALSIIQSHYPAGTFTPASFNAPYTSPPTPPTPVPPIQTNVQPLPNLATRIPINERCYLFGNTQPYPVANPTNCLYYWTALGRVNPGDYSANVLIPSASHRYDIYILVFRKGAADQTFGGTIATPIPYIAPTTDMLGARDPLGTAVNISITYPVNITVSYDPHLEPSVVYNTFNGGTYNATASPPITGAIPPISAYGIGQSSGTVFRQSIEGTYATPRPYLMGTIGVLPSTAPIPTENVIYAPPADGTSVSPLIYVYQTTICQ